MVLKISFGLVRLQSRQTVIASAAIPKPQYSLDGHEAASRPVYTCMCEYSMLGICVLKTQTKQELIRF